MADPNPLVAGRGLAALEAAGIATQVGLLEAEARRLNETYLHYVTTGRPFVLLKWAMTLDGKIATYTGDSQWISGPASRRLVHRQRDEYDAVMVGVGTVLRDDPQLTARLADFGEVPPDGTERQPLRVIVDSQARTPPTARVIQPHGGPPTLIAALDSAPAERVAALRAAGAEVRLLPERDGRVDLTALLEELGRREITSVMIEGGGTLHAGALAAGIVDKVVAFIAPKIIGGADALTPVEGTGVPTLREALLLTDVRVTEVEGDVMVEGYLVK
jgi:diaminohydroxyphosphoribosylaminopyrimidine deaminase/5-amino-6-(5-phosphoribosylamino)uracil reductase